MVISVVAYITPRPNDDDSCL